MSEKEGYADMRDVPLRFRRELVAIHGPRIPLKAIADVSERALRDRIARESSHSGVTALQTTVLAPETTENPPVQAPNEAPTVLEYPEVPIEPSSSEV